MTKATNEFRRCITEVKEAHARQIERLQRERDAALMAARVHADVDDPNNMHQLPGVEIPTTKKVFFLIHITWGGVFLLPRTRIEFVVFFVMFSAPIVTVKRWPNAHYADERHIVQHFANGRTGMRIKLNVHVIQMKPHNKLCYLSMNKHKTIL